MVLLIQIFEIKKKHQNLKNNDTKILEKYLKLSQLDEQEILIKEKTKKEGLV